MRNIRYLTLEIPKHVRDDLEGMYESGVMCADLSPGDHMHTLYSRVFRISIDMVINALISYNLPTARNTDLSDMWVDMGFYESAADFFGPALPTASKIACIVEPLRRNYDRTMKRSGLNALAIDYVSIAKTLDKYTVEVEVEVCPL